MRYNYERMTQHDPATGCWIWLGRFYRGVPIFGKTMVRRALFLESGGRIPQGGRVTFTCEDSRCVAPEHTKALTLRAMLAECHQRGMVYDARWRARQTAGRRKSQGVALDMETARHIRARSAGGVSAMQLGRELGVSASTVDRVIRNEAWRELPTSPLALIAHQAGMLP
jgi:hypothetical protein